MRGRKKKQCCECGRPAVTIRNKEGICLRCASINPSDYHYIDREIQFGSERQAAMNAAKYLEMAFHAEVGRRTAHLSVDHSTRTIRQRQHYLIREG